jgi:hypothetical protein
MISKEALMATSPAYAPSAPLGAGARPVTVGLSSGARWMTGAVIISLMLYYVIGVDQGALSVFGKSMVIHEFVHDARHFLGFPCH